MKEEQPEKASIRDEHFKGIDGYSEVHFYLQYSNDPLPEDIYEKLAVACKDLTDSVFDEIIELGQTPSLVEVENAVSGFVMEALLCLKRQGELGNRAKEAFALASFNSLADLHLLLNEFKGMPELEELF